MNGSAYLQFAYIVAGLVLAVLAPRLVRKRIFLPPPRSSFAQVAHIIFGEAFSGILIMTGLRGLFGVSSFSTLLTELIPIFFIVAFAVFVGGAVAEATYVEDGPSDKDKDQDKDKQ